MAVSEKRVSPEEELELFRKALEDVEAIASRLAPVCDSVQELVELVSLAKGNAAQLRLLHKEVTQGKR